MVGLMVRLVMMMLMVLMVVTMFVMVRIVVLFMVRVIPLGVFLVVVGFFVVLVVLFVVMAVLFESWDELFHVMNWIGLVVLFVEAVVVIFLVGHFGAEGQNGFEDFIQYFLRLVLQVFNWKMLFVRLVMSTVRMSPAVFFVLV